MDVDLLSDGLCCLLEGKDFLFAIVEDSQITLVLAGDGCLSQFAFVDASDTPWLAHGPLTSYFSCLPFLWKSREQIGGFTIGIAVASRKHLRLARSCRALKWWMGIKRLG